MYKKLARYALLCIGMVAATLSFGFSSYSDNQGQMQDNVYTNSVLGFSIKFPEEWNPAARDNTNAGALLDVIKNNTILLFNMSADSGKSGILAKTVQFSAADKGEFSSDEQILEQIKFLLIRTSKIRPEWMGNVTQTQLGELNFASMDIKFIDHNYVVKETLYAVTRNDHILFFITTYQNKEQETAIQKTFNTMLFY